MLVRYRGHRAIHRDNIYQTGDWAAGQVKDVPDAVGVKLLRHPDVYETAAQPKTGTVEKVEETAPQLEANEAARVQNARDIVNGMTEKQAVADFALANYQRKLDQRQSLDNMKREAVMLIDQYGLP